MFKKILFIIFGILFALSLAASFYFYRQYAALSQTPSQDSSQQAQAEVKRLVAALGRLIVLPANEQPTIATVADPDTLRDQPFFANARKGDKVFIYTNANKAILYSPTEDKIVEVAPISLGQAPSTTSTGGQTPTSTAQSSSTSSSTVKSSLTPSKKK